MNYKQKIKGIKILYFKLKKEETELEFNYSIYGKNKIIFYIDNISDINVIREKRFNENHIKINLKYKGIKSKKILIVLDNIEPKNLIEVSNIKSNMRNIEKVYIKNFDNEHDSFNEILKILVPELVK